MNWHPGCLFRASGARSLFPRLIAQTSMDKIRGEGKRIQCFLPSRPLLKRDKSPFPLFQRGRKGDFKVRREAAAFPTFARLHEAIVIPNEERDLLLGVTKGKSRFLVRPYGLLGMTTGRIRSYRTSRRVERTGLRPLKGCFSYIRGHSASSVMLTLPDGASARRRACPPNPDSRSPWSRAGGIGSRRLTSFTADIFPLTLSLSPALSWLTCLEHPCG
jgi:hypothetical protein